MAKKRHIVGGGTPSKTSRAIKWALDKEFRTVVFAVVGGVAWSWLEWKGYQGITRRLDGIEQKMADHHNAASSRIPP